MAISYIGTGTPGTTTTTLPAHVAGDYILIGSFRDGSNTAPGLAAGYTNIQTNATNSAGARMGFKIATSSGETSGTWSSATTTICMVYRSSTGTLVTGGSAVATGASTTVSYPALTMLNRNSTSWVAGIAGHRSIDTSLETPPTGMTNRIDSVDATDEMAGHDTNGTVNAWSLQTVSVGGTSSGWAGFTVEIAEINPMASLQDLFDQGTRNATLWDEFTGGSATIGYGATGVTVTFPAATTALTDGDLSSTGTYLLTGSSAYQQVLAVPTSITATDAELRLRIDASNYIRWVYEAGTLYAQYNVAGVKTTAFSVAYNASTHLYWRIRESGGNTLWDTSSDGTSFTNQASVANPIAVTALTVLIAGLGTTADVSPGTYKWNNFNVQPSAPSSPGTGTTLMMMGI